MLTVACVPCCVGGATCGNSPRPSWRRWAGTRSRSAARASTGRRRWAPSSRGRSRGERRTASRAPTARTCRRRRTGRATPARVPSSCCGGCTASTCRTSRRAREVGVAPLRAGPRQVQVAGLPGAARRRVAAPRWPAVQLPGPLPVPVHGARGHRHALPYRRHVRRETGQGGPRAAVCCRPAGALVIFFELLWGKHATCGASMSFRGGVRGPGVFLYARRRPGAAPGCRMATFLRNNSPGASPTIPSPHPPTRSASSARSPTASSSPRKLP